MKRIIFLLLALCAGIVPGAHAAPPLLLQKPTLSQDRIVFVFAGDLWTVARSGGEAQRLTVGVGVETDPHFSPDGTQIAFTGQYDGNTDVYVVPATGGVPKRLLWHPAPDEVVGWTPDGKQILFRSSRLHPHDMPRLYTIPATGGTPTELPLPIGLEGCFSPDGKQIAYVPKAPWQRAWKRYRGGQTTPIWVMDLSTLQYTEIPRNNSNDTHPMWIGDKIYFLSDRDGPTTLYCYDRKTKRVRQMVQPSEPNASKQIAEKSATDLVVKPGDFDLKSASAGPGGIVYEKFGSLWLLDTTTNKTERLQIRLTGDMPEVRPHYVKVGNRIGDADLSPTGMRAVFQARGEIFTVPAEKGDIRNLTNTPGVREMLPAWSPDGKWIACFSDESGEYALHLIPQNGKGETKKIAIESPSFYQEMLWSPDSKKLAYRDKHLTLWMLDIEQGKPVKVDTNPKFFYGIQFAWSPDSRWLVYARQLKSFMSVLFVYSVASGKSTQITDGLSDARYPAFDRSGKYIYFTASTDIGLTVWFGNMSGMNRPVTRSVYVMVLRKDLPSPLAPESDEEKPGEKKDTEAKKEDAAKKAEGEKQDGSEKKDEAKTDTKEVAEVRIDFDRIGQRILSLPIPAKNYNWLIAGKEGNIFLQETPAIGFGSQSLHRFDLNARKFETLLSGLGSYALSANGEKLLYSQGERWAITAASGPFNATAGTLNLSSMEVYSDPRAEWKQMFHETWRAQRDFFYLPNLHGLDWQAADKQYAPFLEGIVSRGDLNYLFEEMLGELTVSHMFVGGGDQPEAKTVGGGLLGADFAIENGRFRITRVYDGENWNPNLRAPLTQPGVNVAAGEYLLAVNGREALPTDEVYKYFEGTAGKQITLKVGPTPDGRDAREVTVVPVADESNLRQLAWIEDNRRKVDKLSDGRLAYVWLPNTGGGGYTNFNRYYFGQLGKEGAIIDERFNRGGLIADYIIDYLRRPLMGYFHQRDGDDIATPAASIYGPKVMLINEFAGSGGDAMPWLFRAAKIGPLIGKRTWGGLVGVSGFQLMDGGVIGPPQSGFWNPNGTWDVENHGVAPDIEIENDPVSMRAGKDLQLEKGVEWLLAELKRNPLPVHKLPDPPDYHKKP